jgi:VWFA-related protein
MHTYRGIPLALAALSALTGFFSGTAPGEDSGAGLPTYCSSVSEVRVTFFANDENNRPLENVTMGDVAIVDNERVIRNFRSFARSDETSLDVVVLVDLSESIAPRFRTTMNEVLRLVAQEQSIGSDNFPVLSFGGNPGRDVGGPATTSGSNLTPVVVCTRRCSGSDSVARFLEVANGGATPLYDALIFASDFIAQRRRSGVRPVVILFSDGDDTVSMHSRSEALRAVRDAGVLIYSVDLGMSKNRASGSASYSTSSYHTSGSGFLRQASEVSGGRYFSFSEVSSQHNAGATVLSAVLADLRASYVITYDLPDHHLGFHSLRLLPTHNLNLTFHSRDGYDYEPGSPQF